MEESLTFNDEKFAESLYDRNSEAVLIYSGSLFALYRLSIDGKYFLFKTSVNDDNISTRLLRREYEMSIGCDHPNVVHVVLFGRMVNGREGILMEYVEGRTLSDYLAENPSDKAKMKILRELLEAVSYLHKKGIVHNDLKPQNIMVTRKGDNLKLIDFGLSDDDAHFLIKTPGCTSAFAAPELKGERQSDFRSDVYSIGVIAETMFGDKYRKITSKCLQSSPDRRFQNIEELQNAFEQRARRVRKIVFGFLSIILFACVVMVANEIFARKEYARNVENSLDEQKQIIKKQNQDYEKLRKAYTNLSESYRDVNTSFEQLKDSLVNETIEAQKRNQRIDEHIEKFRKELSAKADGLVRYIKSTGSAAQANESLPQLMKQLSDYYETYPKIVAGEDVETKLKNVYVDILDQTGKRLQREIKSLDNETHRKDFPLTEE